MQKAKKLMQGDQLARGIGWFSIGLGLASILAPRSVARLIGVRGHHSGLIRLVGLREIASGIGILSHKPDSWVKSRVGGDAMDLALLTSAFTSNGNDKGRVCAATAAVAGITAMDLMCSRKLSQMPDGGRDEVQGVHVIKVVTINRSVEELYQYWHNFENLPRFMRNLDSVQRTGERTSHWVAKGPAGAKVEWDAETTEDVPNQRIAWRSLESANIQHSGQVTFQPLPGDRGTAVRAEINYRILGGVLGSTFARLSGSSPEQEIMQDLRRLKQLLETGEIATTEGQSAGRKKGTSRKFDYAARSMAEAT